MVEYLRPNQILEDIIRDSRGDAKKYTYIILGRSGPTGKTWLCNELRVRGFNAFEISEDIGIFNLVAYKDDENHYITNELYKHVTIVLNRWLF